MAWYYKAGDQEIGPVSKAELQQLIKDKKINAKTLVRSTQMDQWRPLAEIVRGQGKAKPASPPPPPQSSEIATAASSGSQNDDKAHPSQTAPAPDSMNGRQAASAAIQGADSADASEAHSTAVCSQCGRSFPDDQVLTYEGQTICAACKPMFIQKLREGAGMPGNFHYGGFWIRFLAKFIDGIIMAVGQWAILIPASMLLAPTLGQGGDRFPTSGFAAFVGFQVLVGIFIPAGYNTFFLGRFGATLGKMACRLKVVTPEGGQISYARALGRFFAEMISYIILAIGYIMAAFDDEKRTLHDRICSTRVVYKA